MDERKLRSCLSARQSYAFTTNQFILPAARVLVSARLILAPSLLSVQQSGIRCLNIRAIQLLGTSSFDVI